MFKGIFSAMSKLTASILALSATFEEANATLRERLSLDSLEEAIETDSETPTLTHKANGRKAVKASS